MSGVEIYATTTVLGVIGHPIEHSFSPQMHNAAIRALGLDWCYVAFHVLPEDVGRAMEGMRGLGIRGLNVTVPHKQAVRTFLDEISEEARAVGAVNTISNEGGRLIGTNTDVYGILTSLRETAGLKGLPGKVVVLGAGGAARGVVYALTTVAEVAEIVVLNRTEAKAHRLAEEMAKRSGKRVEGGALVEGDLRRALEDAGLLINATSVGMYPKMDASPIGDWDVLRPGLTVYDAVFNPLETRLMQQAQEAGARAFGGIEMLVYQGARSLDIWSGRPAPVAVMKQAVLGQLHTTDKEV